MAKAQAFFQAMHPNSEINRPRKAHLKPIDASLAAFLGLLLLGIYMVTFDGTLHSTDGLSMLAVTENLVKHGGFDTRQLENWESARLGIDGKPHTVFPIGPALFMIPFYALALAWPRLGLVQTTMILMPLFSALTGGYIYLGARRLGYAPKTGIAVTLLAGLATMTWLRTRDLVADPLVLFSLTATFYYALAYRQDQKASQAALMGLALGISVLHKVVNIVTAPFFFGYLTLPDFSISNVFKKIDRRALAVAAIPVAVSILLVGGYNALRFGHPLDSGYRQSYAAILRTPFWIGIAGHVINPYKSVFLYLPLFILIPFTIRKTWRKHRYETALILALLAGYLVTYGSFYDWGGGRNWGPRYLAPLNSLLTLLLLPFVDQAVAQNHRRSRVILIGFTLTSLFIQVLGISARDNAFLGAVDYWTPPPNLSFWGELSWDNPAQWPIWGHWLLFDPGQIPVIWRWQWEELTHFDLPSLLAALMIVTMGLGGVIIFYRRERAARLWPMTTWLVALACVAFILVRNYDDPRSIERASEAAELWPDYSSLVSQLPQLVKADDAVIFTDRRFEFYLLDMDKSPAQRYVVAKPTQPEILETVPRLLQPPARRGRIWLVTDELDNRQLAYAVELWLRARGRASEHYRFGRSVQLTAFEPSPSATWDPIPPEPQLAGLVNPDDYTFNRIASLLGWRWPGLDDVHPPNLQPGRAYKFELYWIYRGKAPDDLFFVRLLDDTGQVALEAFTTPRPGSHLIPGQLIIEDATIVLPAGFSPGIYHLQIGFLIPVVAEGELIFSLPEAMTGVRVGP